jgi:NADH-quinone oxidoreductase subunit L
MSVKTLAILIPLLPFLGFVINGLGFRTLGKSLAAGIGISAASLSFGLSLWLFAAMSGSGVEAQDVQLFNWISTENTQIGFSFLIDHLTLIFLLVVTGVGTLIHIYSAGYMHDDEGFGKFFSFLNLFLAAMLVLVMGNNFLVMFIGWEGVGLCSYLLIGFWNKNTDYNNAARKAFVMNRIGDLGFLLGIFLIYITFNSLDYNTVISQALAGSPGEGVMVAITLLLFVGAMGKSAQIPLYTWLPDAMAGPTPVSALIHAATMVTAGIYMVIRANVLFTLAPFTMDFIAIVGLTTALLAASIGLLQNDIKKVLAYSTVSQLGYMFLALGVGAFSSSYFHVMTHAFFKALLFLGAGSVIHGMSGEQDIRSMGGLKSKMPVTFYTFLIATIAISGIPPFAGFFSKDEILAHVFEHSPVMWGLAVVGSLMTSFYMFRLLFLTFYGEFRGTENQKHHLHESPFSMTMPLMILAVLSAIGGFFNFPALFGGHQWLAHFLAPIVGEVSHNTSPEHITTEYILMGVSTLGALVSMFVAYSMYVGKKQVPDAEGTQRGIVNNLVYNKYYVDELYESLIVKPLSSLGSIIAEFLDVYIVDGVVQFSGGVTMWVGKQMRYLQAGAIGVYVFSMVLGILIILTFNFLF